MPYPRLSAAAARSCTAGLMLLAVACGDDGGGDADVPEADAAQEPDAQVGEPDAAPPSYDVAVEGAITDTDMRGGGGGSLHEDACADGAALVGFAGTRSGSIDAVGGLCADLEVDAEGITAGEPTALPVWGTTPSNEQWERLCPAGHVVIGFRGRAGLLLDELTFRCAPLSVTDDGSGPVLTIGDPVELDPAGAPNSAEFEQTDCPAGQIAAEARIRNGDSVDALGLGCRAAAIVVVD